VESMIFRDGASDMEFLERSVFRVRAFSRDQRAIDCYQMRNGLPAPRSTREGRFIYQTKSEIKEVNLRLLVIAV
jgi:hypothetical protein